MSEILAVVRWRQENEQVIKKIISEAETAAQKMDNLQKEIDSVTTSLGTLDKKSETYKKQKEVLNGLLAQQKALNEEQSKGIGILGGLNKKVDALRTALLNATDVEDFAKINKELLETEKRISSLQKLGRVQDNTGIIFGLNERVSELKNTLLSATDETEIAKINKELLDTEKRLSSLYKLGKEDKSVGLLSNLNERVNELRKSLLSATDVEDFAKINKELLDTEKRISSLQKLGVEQKNVGFLDSLKSSLGGGIFSGAALGTLVGGAVLQGIQSLSSGLITLGKNILDTNAKFQVFESVATNALGSRSAAVDLLKLTSDLAAQTNFSISEVTEGAIKLVNSLRITPTEEQLRSLFDLSNSAGKSFKDLIFAVEDAATRQFERLKEFGINVNTVGDKLKINFRGQQTTIENTRDAIVSYLFSLGQLNGVSGQTAAVARTTAGALSNLGDNIEIIYKNLGDRTNGAIRTFVDLLLNATGVLREFTAVPVSESLRIQQNEISSLITLLGVANNAELKSAESTELRAYAIGQLNANYPELFANLDLEKLSNEELNGVLQQTIDLYNSRIKVSLQQEFYKQIKEEADAANSSVVSFVNNIGKVNETLDTGIGAVTKSFGFFSPLITKTADKLVDAAKSSYELTQSQRFAVQQAVIEANAISNSFERQNFLRERIVASGISEVRAKSIVFDLEQLILDAATKNQSAAKNKVLLSKTELSEKQKQLQTELDILNAAGRQTAEADKQRRILRLQININEAKLQGYSEDEEARNRSFIDLQRFEKELKDLQSVSAAPTISKEQTKAIDSRKSAILNAEKEIKALQLDSKRDLDDALRGANELSRIESIEGINERYRLEKEKELILLEDKKSAIIEKLKEVGAATTFVESGFTVARENISKRFEALALKARGEFLEKQRDLIKSYNDKILLDSQKYENDLFEVKREAFKDDFSFELAKANNTYNNKVKEIERLRSLAQKEAETQAQRRVSVEGVSPEIAKAEELAKINNIFDLQLQKAEIDYNNARVKIASDNVREYDNIAKDLFNAKTNELQSEANLEKTFLAQSYENGKISKEEYEKEKQKIENKYRLISLQKEREFVLQQINDIKATLQNNADVGFLDSKTVKDLESKLLSLGITYQNLGIDISETNKTISNENYTNALKDFIGKVENGYLSLLNTVQNVNDSIAESESEKYDKLISLQKERIAKATEIAEEGNVEQLRIEREKLIALDAQRIESARRQNRINNIIAIGEYALAAAKSAVAIADAAKYAPDPVSKIVSIVATAASLAASTFGLIAKIKAQSEVIDIPSFYKGTPYLDGKESRKDPNGDNILLYGKRGERIVTVENNEKYKDIYNYLEIKQPDKDKALHSIKNGGKDFFTNKIYIDHSKGLDKGDLLLKETQRNNTLLENFINIFTKEQYKNRYAKNI